jgi:hypothetical protein
MRRSLGWTAMLVLWAVIGCEAAPDNVVEGLAAPTILQPSDVHELGTSASIADVEDLEVLSDGSIWVLNSVDPFFIGFDPDGNVLQEHGRRGGGPEEFSAPAGFVSGGLDGAAWTFDIRRHTLIEVSQPQSSQPQGPRSEIRIPADSIPPGTLRGGMNLMDMEVRTARMGDEVVVARSYGTMQSGMLNFWSSMWGADLLAFDPTTQAVRGVANLSEVLGDPSGEIEMTSGFPPFPLWYRLWAVCSDTELRVYDRLGNQVRTFASDGREIGAVPLPPNRLESVTDRQFVGAVFGLMLAERMGEVGGNTSPADSARLINEMLQEIEGEPEHLASFLPRYVDFRCTREGTVWIQPFDPDRGGLRGGLAWLRITADGATDEVHLPDRFDAYRFSGDRIWGIQRDEFDVATVAWIAVPAGS